MLTMITFSRHVGLAWRRDISVLRNCDSLLLESARDKVYAFEKFAVVSLERAPSIVFDITVTEKLVFSMWTS